MPRRTRMNWPLWIGIGALFASVMGFICWPMLDAPMAATQSQETFEVRPHLTEVLRERAMAALTGMWIFFFGAAMGSFLNVVAYRMPLGLTIVSKPSRCPHCMTPIQFKHNVPVLGWFILRGRCRACRLPIAARYVLVELLVGTLFFGLFCFELASGGRNLPIRQPTPRAGVMWNVFTPQWDLIGQYSFHCFLLGTLTAIALIMADRSRIPFRLPLFALTLGVVVRLWWPTVSVIPPWNWVPMAWIPLPLSVVRVGLDLGFGLVVGLIFHKVVQCRTPRETPGPCLARIAIFTLVALFAGWQIIVPSLLLAALGQLVLTLAGRLPGFRTTHLWGFSLLLGTWVAICFWRQLPQLWLPGAESGVMFQAASIAFGMATAFVAESLAVTAADDANEVSDAGDADEVSDGFMV